MNARGRSLVRGGMRALSLALARVALGLGLVACNTPDGVVRSSLACSTLCGPNNVARIEIESSRFYCACDVPHAPPSPRIDGSWWLGRPDASDAGKVSP